MAHITSDSSSPPDLQISELERNLAIILQSYIVPYTVSYFLGIGSILSLINNILVITALVFGKEISKHLSPSVRVYYILIAASDLNVTLSLYLNYSLGMPRI